MLGMLGSLAGGIAGQIFGGITQRNAERRQWEHENQMLDKSQQYALDMAAKNQEYAKEMNQINFDQANQMFDKTAEYNSASAQKDRLKAAGMNPALMYGLGSGGGGQAVGGGGGAGSGSAASASGTQAVAMGLQAKSIMAQIASTTAQIAKTKAETRNIEKDTENKGYEGEKTKQETSFISNQNLTETEKRKLLQSEFKVNMSVEQLNLANTERARAEVDSILRGIEKLRSEVESINLDNEWKSATMESRIAEVAEGIKNKIQERLESQSRVQLNENQKNVLQQTVMDLVSIRTNRDMDGEQQRTESQQRISKMLQDMRLDENEDTRATAGKISEEIRQWLGLFAGRKE